MIVLKCWKGTDEFGCDVTIIWDPWVCDVDL
jgi:hypothetical protein